ncbi:MAG: glycosyltransferase [Clostridia bacterium]|nr:glycosyltransferase [Clostridia bacterium]
MKKNIIFVSTALWIGGIESALVNLLNSIDYNKFNVTLLITYNYTDMANRLPKECNLIIADRDNLISFKKPYKYSRLFHLLEKPQNASSFRLFIWKVLCLLFKAPEAHLYAKYVKKQMKNQKFDTAIIYSDVVSETAVKGIKADKFIMFYHHGAMRKVYHDKYGYKRSSKIVAVSHSQAEALREFRHEYKNKIIAINNIIDVDDIKKRSEEKMDIEFSKDKFNIVSCGRLSPEKGMDLAIDACKILVDKGYNNFKWRVVGGGPIEKHLADQIQKLGVQDYIQLLGMQSNPYPFIKNADLLVQPSRFEGHSVAIMEAKILGTPIVATKSAAKEQIQHRTNGVLCDTTAESIANAIEKVLNDKELLKKITLAVTKEDFNKRNDDIIKTLYNIF